MARLIGTAAVAGVVLASLTGCAVDSTRVDEASPPAAIVVGSGQSAESQVIAEIYAGALRAAGAPVQTRLRLAPGQDLVELDAGSVTLVPEYTGSLLDRFHPGAAETDPDTVFEELNRSLPEGLSVSDYAMAEEPGTGAEPQNVVPLMRTGALTEEQVKALNVVAGELTSTDLAELAEQVRGGRGPGEVAADWLAAR
ncbi:glycine betaine ABC transporter substrate-binding protein [Rhodococcus kronopolitis]|uniref:Glycine betaine ABC transporter substrate-binding protein n=1 Tax=Rhodococcus kronopolitis TaxID=1460226 RepID=A0ABV9FUM7_9NOCA